ncbi:sulfate anion transporter [Penicillium lagena]|uniref:sulfate anion transporter n=1 Tax=Penicillium lagena TaxID=94218 RepID=UPI0025422B0C|nr:sulfate anion transporter [Penicillium lagena]KAJ5625518.1 sulfate anion transporter [Penicillium lagena]
MVSTGVGGKVKRALGLQEPLNNPLNGKVSEIATHHEADPTVSGWLNEAIPSGSQVRSYFVRLFPFMGWILHYNMKWFLGDLVAGM